MRHGIDDFTRVEVEFSSLAEGIIGTEYSSVYFPSIVTIGKMKLLVLLEFVLSILNVSSVLAIGEEGRGFGRRSSDNCDYRQCFYMFFRVCLQWGNRFVAHCFMQAQAQPSQSPLL